MSRRPSSRRLSGDSGFTLIDTVLAVGLTTTIMGVLAAAIMVTLGPDQDALERSVSSHDGQVAAMWLPADLASAGPVDPTADVAPGAGLSCTGATPGANVLRLGWNQPVPVSTNTAVSYRVVPVGPDWRLVRYACTNGGAVASHVVVEQLAGPSAVQISFRGQRQVSVAFTTALGDPYSITAARRTPDAANVATTTTTSNIPVTTTTTPPTTTTTAPTTTTTAPTTTTTAPTTTTTTAACSVTSVTPSPFVVFRTSSRRLAVEVDVTVATTGSCTGLRLSFSPDGGTPTVLPLTKGTGTTWSTTIPGQGDAGAETWTATTKTLRVLPASGTTAFPTTGSLVVL